MRKAVNNMLAPLARRVSLMVGRASLAAVIDGGKRQFIQFMALAGEVKDKVEHVQPYGFASHAEAGAQVIFLSVGGNRDHVIAICVDDPRKRIGLEPGEVAIFTDNGNKIVMKPDGTIEVTTTTMTIKASDKVRCETPRFEVTGDIVDQCDTTNQSMAQGRAIYNSHTHDENNNPGGQTDTPNQQMGGA